MNTGQKRDMEEFIFSANCNGSFTQYKTLFTFQQSEVNYMAIFSCELCWKLRSFFFNLNLSFVRKKGERAF